MIKCNLCESETSPLFKAKVLNKYDVSYFKCTNCDFIQTESPYWLSEAYSNAIVASDTGIMRRNIELAKSANIILSQICDKKHGVFLDYGGGYGILTRLMRDKGFDFYCYDKFATNLVAKGFDKNSSVSNYTAITSFENFEHFENPLVDIEKIFSLSDIVLFSTILVPAPTPSGGEWWYYGLEHGQHISLFSKKSLQFIAKKYGYNCISNGKNMHIFSKRKISKYILFLEIYIRKIGFEKLFWGKSKIVEDMNSVIKTLAKDSK